MGVVSDVRTGSLLLGEVGTSDDCGTRLGELQSQWQPEGAVVVGTPDDGLSEADGAMGLGTLDDGDMEAGRALVVGTPDDGLSEAEGAMGLGILDDADMEAGGTKEVGTPDGVAVPFPVPPTPKAWHPGTSAAGLAGSGPSVTATQPGRYGSNCPSITDS
jgi:hypothetical protein